MALNQKPPSSAVLRVVITLLDGMSQRRPSLVYFLPLLWSVVTTEVVQRDVRTKENIVPITCTHTNPHRQLSIDTMKFSALVLCMAVGSTAAFSTPSGLRTSPRGTLLSSTLDEVETKAEVPPVAPVPKVEVSEVSESPVVVSEAVEEAPVKAFVPTNNAPDKSRIKP